MYSVWKEMIPLYKLKSNRLKEVIGIELFTQNSKKSNVMIIKRKGNDEFIFVC